MDNNSFIEWLEDFLKEIEHPEFPCLSKDEFKSGWNSGAYETQTFIARKLRYALTTEKERRARDLEKQSNAIRESGSFVAGSTLS
jgi:hypothetical protein